MINDKQIGKRVIARTAAPPYPVYGTGKVVAYYDVPSVVIEMADGTRFQWRADLCEESCPSCGGHGRDPMSDNMNWLPCSACGGTGNKR